MCKFLSADESVFIASWGKEEYSGSKKEPYNTFTINLKIDEKYKTVGSFTYVTRWGSKIDGPNDITGVLDKKIWCSHLIVVLKDIMLRHKSQ